MGVLGSVLGATGRCPDPSSPPATSSQCQEGAFVPSACCLCFSDKIQDNRNQFCKQNNMSLCITQPAQRDGSYVKKAANHGPSSWPAPWAVQWLQKGHCALPSWLQPASLGGHPTLCPGLRLRACRKAWGQPLLGKEPQSIPGTMGRLPFATKTASINSAGAEKLVHTDTWS